MKKTQIIGGELPNGTQLHTLDAELARMMADGFDAVELSLASFPLILGGKVQQRVVDYMRPILEKYPMRYTAHVGLGMDLRDLEHMEMQRAVMFASIDVSHALGMRLVNFHYEEQSRFAERERAMTQNIRDAADYAAARGLAMNVENIEIELLSHAADFVRTLQHPNVGLTLDTGHLWLSARYFGYDYLEAVRACAPLVRHVHVNDNTGDFEPLRITDRLKYDAQSLGNRFEYGRGDIHIPPLWGNAPLRETFQALKEAGYDGIWLLEYYNERFIPFNASVCAEVRRAIEEA